MKAKQFKIWYTTNNGRVAVFVDGEEMATQEELQSAHKYASLSDEILAQSDAADQVEIAEREVLHPLVDPEYFDMSADARHEYAVRINARRTQESRERSLAHRAERYIKKLFKQLTWQV